MEKQLHIISTGKQTVSELLERMEQIHSYIDFFHLRERNWTAKECIFVIEKLIEMGVKKEKIIMNDRVDIATVTGVGGVQLASHSIDPSYVKRNYPQLRVGCSVHSVNEAVRQEKAGASFLLYGHIFTTTSKGGLAPRGLTNLRRVVKSVNIPVIAIGGVKPDNVESVIRAGARGVAILSGVLLADNVKEAVKQYKKALTKEEV